MSQIERALDVDPFNSLFQALYGMDLMYARRYDDAIGRIRDTLKTSPNDLVALSTLRSALHMKHLYTEALEVWKQSYAARDDREAEEALARVRGGWLHDALCGAWPRHWWLARKRPMFRPGRSEHFIPVPKRRTKPSNGWKRPTRRVTRICPISALTRYFDTLRDDPRYQGLLRKMKLK